MGVEVTRCRVQRFGAAMTRADFIVRGGLVAALLRSGGPLVVPVPAALGCLSLK